MLLPSSTSCFLLKHALELWLEVCTWTQRHTTYPDSGQKNQDSQGCISLMTHSCHLTQQARPSHAWLIDACKEFGLTISKKKTNGMGQDVKYLPLPDFHQFNYLGSTVTYISSQDANINKRFGKAATTLGRLCIINVWENPKLTRWQSTMPAMSALSYMIVKCGQPTCTPSKRASWMVSTCDVSLHRWRQLDRQDTQHRGPSTGLSAQHVNAAQLSKTLLDWSYFSM